MPGAKAPVDGVVFVGLKPHANPKTRAVTRHGYARMGIYEAVLVTAVTTWAARRRGPSFRMARPASVMVVYGCR